MSTIDIKEADLSGQHINECVERLPGWLREAGLEVAHEAHMLACVVERVTSRFNELERCLYLAMAGELAGLDDGALLATAVGAEFGLSSADECLMGAAAIIQLAACGAAADPYRARDAALKHAHQHREEYGEPLLLRDLSDFYRRSQDQQK